MKLQRLKPYSLLTGFILALLLTMWITYIPFPHVVRVSDSEYPNENVPVIVGAGEKFKIFVKAQSVKVNDEEVQVENGFVQVPENLGPGWYNLTFFIDGEDVRENAMYVPPYTSENFTFVFMCDMHTPPMGAPYIEERKRVADLINDIGPAFVIDAGDMTDFGLEEEYDWYEWIISGFEMPLYTLPGNHETYADPNLERYARRLGPSNYFFYFGDVLFVAAAPLHAYRGWGGFDEDQIKWLGDTLSKEAKLKFVLNHIPTVYHEGREYAYVPWCRKEGYYTQIEQGHDEMVEIFTREKVVNLFGHWHIYTQKFEYRGATFYHTPSVTRNSFVKEGPRFRLFRIENNEIVFDEVIELGKLTITRREYAPDNMHVTIVNEEEFSIPLTIRVEMSPAGYPYATSLGEIVAARPGECILWIRIEATPGTTEIEIAPQT